MMQRNINGKSVTPGTLNIKFSLAERWEIRGYLSYSLE